VGAGRLAPSSNSSTGALQPAAHRLQPPAARCRHVDAALTRRVRARRRQSSFPPGTFAPYQVRLDNGKLIYAPIDEDRVCRAYNSDAAPAEADDFADEDEELPDDKKLAVTVRRPPARHQPTRPAPSPPPAGGAHCLHRPRASVRLPGGGGLGCGALSRSGEAAAVAAVAAV
jgi:hypothetical protein